MTRSTFSFKSSQLVKTKISSKVNLFMVFFNVVPTKNNEIIVRQKKYHLKHFFCVLDDIYMLLYLAQKSIDSY